MFTQHVVSPKPFAARFVELLPEYLPGLDTGAFEPTDRRRCWNKTLKAVLTVIGQDDLGLSVAVQSPAATLPSQFSLLWEREGTALFAMITGWGDRSELETALQWLEAFKCPQKLLVYTCNRWHEAVIDQIHAALLRYSYHIEGEQYLFMNLSATDKRLHLLSAEVERSGLHSPANGPLLQAVAGSPFSW